MTTESYIQYASGYSKENVTLQDIITALSDLERMDDEHDAFWVGVINNDENVLETHKDLIVIGIFEDEPATEIRGQVSSLSEAKELYELFLKGDFDTVRTRIRAKG